MSLGTARESFGIPLLTLARVFGPEIERRALEASRAMSLAKRLIQADERQIAQGRELVEVLRGMGCQTFRPAELVASLEECEKRCEVLSEKKDQKAKAASIGRYLSGFRIPSRDRTRTGSTYDQIETAEVIGRHIPRTQPEKTATPATSATDPAKTRGSVVANHQTDLQQDSAEGPVPTCSVAYSVADQPIGVPREHAGKHKPCGSVPDVADNSGTEEELRVLPKW